MASCMWDWGCPAARNATFPERMSQSAGPGWSLPSCSPSPSLQANLDGALGLGQAPLRVVAVVGDDFAVRIQHHCRRKGRGQGRSAEPSQQHPPPSPQHKQYRVRQVYGQRPPRFVIHPRLARRLLRSCSRSPMACQPLDGS